MYFNILSFFIIISNLVIFLGLLIIECFFVVLGFIEIYRIFKIRYYKWFVMWVKNSDVLKIYIREIFVLKVFVVWWIC